MDIIGLKKVYRKKKVEIKERLQVFSEVKGDDIFYELCFCLLTPQSKAKICWANVLKLKEKGLFNRDFQPSLTGVRFPKNKIKYLVQAKKDFPEVNEGIKNIEDAKELREYLVEQIKGLGCKEASHFLRNIGYKNLAILDRHILRRLVEFGIVKNIPKNLTRKKYLEIEELFKSFAEETKIPIDELDLLFWSLGTGEIFK